MYSQDHPNELKFTRPGKTEAGLAESLTQAGRSDVLTGEALEKYLKPRIPNQATLDKLRGNVASGNVVRMGARK